jgi:hypothetical protein
MTTIFPNLPTTYFLSHVDNLAHMTDSDHDSDSTSTLDTLAVPPRSANHSEGARGCLRSWRLDILI